MFDKLAQVTPAQWAMAAAAVCVFFSISAWAILDCWKRNYEIMTEKVAWVQIIIFIPILGALAYVFIGRKRGESPK